MSENMSTPFKPEWLEPGAVIPVDIPTLAAFAEELRRVNQENQALRQANERCEEHPDHQTGMIQERMQEEIDELRQALEANGGNCYGDGTIYRGQRSKDSAVKTYNFRAKLKEKNHG